jgi:carbamoyltransferase
MAEEERFTRTKHGLRQQPTNAVAYCLRQAQIGLDDVDVVAVGWDVPRVHKSHGVAWGPGSEDRLLAEIGFRATRRPELVFVSHHRAHAISAAYASGVRDAAVLVVDGNGEDECTSLFEARADGAVERRWRLPIARSLGLMFTVVSETLGFGVFGAGKTMGLASYGRAAGMQPWEMLDEDSEPPFDYDASDSYERVMSLWRAHINKLLGSHSVPTDSNVLDTDPVAVRLAWSAQLAVEKAMVRLVQRAREETGLADVCLAGGVALNCSANGLLPPPVHALPVPHDAGAALGAAWSQCSRRPHEALDPYLGCDIDSTRGVEALLADRYQLDRVLDLLCAGKVGALAIGRAEIGPRALGHRSIIALPRSAAVRDLINQRKGRERWRPLAPVARLEDAAAFWSVRPTLQRYMLGATRVTEVARRDIPGAIHVDDTVRAQIVEQGAGELLYQLLSAMSDAGVPPVLFNTSFNTRGEPLVNTASEAITAFNAIHLDFMVLGDRLLVR